MNSAEARAPNETRRNVEQRRHERHVVELPGLLRLPETRGGIYSVTVLDLSRSGLRVSCPCSVASGTRVEVMCRNVRIAGTVRHAREVADGVHLGIEADAAEAGGNTLETTELDLTALFPNDRPRLRRA